MTANPLAGWSVDPADLTLTGTGLRRPECVLAEPSGDLWVADLGGGVVHIRPDGGQETIRPTDGGGPFAPDENPNIDGNQGFSMPNGLCFDADGHFAVGALDPCVVGHAIAYLEDRVLPPEGTVCVQQGEAFPTAAGASDLSRIERAYWALPTSPRAR